jgi:hypothetical protein
VQLARNACWILLGVLVGTAACSAIVHLPAPFTATDGAPTLTLAALLLLAATTRQPSVPYPA